MLIPVTRQSSFRCDLHEKLGYKQEDSINKVSSFRFESSIISHELEGMDSILRCRGGNKLVPLSVY